MHLLLRYNCISCINSLQSLTVLIQGGSNTDGSLFQTRRSDEKEVETKGTTHGTIVLVWHATPRTPGLHITCRASGIYAQESKMDLKLVKCVFVADWIRIVNTMVHRYVWTSGRKIFFPRYVLLITFVEER